MSSVKLITKSEIYTTVHFPLEYLICFFLLLRLRPTVNEACNVRRQTMRVMINDTIILVSWGVRQAYTNITCTHTITYKWKTIIRLCTGIIICDIVYNSGMHKINDDI